MIDREQIDAWRRRRMWDRHGAPVIGASSIPVVLGLSSFRTREELLDDYATPGVAPDHSHNLATLAGTVGEDMVLALYEAQTDRTIITAHEVGLALCGERIEGRGRVSSGRPILAEDRANEIAETVHAFARLHYFERDDRQRVILRSREFPWLTCSPDAFWVDEVVGEIGIVDAKIHAESTRKFYVGGRMKPDYRAQLEQQGIVTGLEELSIAAYFGNPSRGVAIYDEGRDDDLTEEIVDAGREFCDEIRRATLPADPSVGVRGG